MKKWILFLLLTSSVFAANMVTKVIQLNYVQADNVIQLVQPLINPGEQISGSGQTLIVKVNPDTLTQIRTILHQIDVPPVSFNIAIHQGDPNWLSAQNKNSVIYSTQPQSEVQRSQSVNVMSGESAFVSTGEEVPIVTAIGGDYYSGIAYQQRNISNGLLIQPALQGSQVKLILKRLREQVNVDGGQQFDNQEINTTVMVPLNKWVSLGSAEGSKNSAPSDTVYTAGRTFSHNSTLYIKVTVPNTMPVGESK